MAGPRLDYQIEESPFANAMGLMDQGRKMALQREMENEQRMIDRGTFSDRMKAQQLEARNKVYQQNMQNQELMDYGQQFGYNFDGAQEQMPMMAQPASPQAIQKEMGMEMPYAAQEKVQAQPKRRPAGTQEDPYSLRELQMRRRARGDQSTIHWHRDADGNLYGVSESGIATTGIQSDPLEGYFKKSDAKKVEEYEKTISSATMSQVTLDEINDILASDTFKDLRTNDFLGASELKWFETFGTPQQKEQIGALNTYMGNIIKDASRDFKGTFRSGEQGLLNSMKPNPSDTLSAMKGKAAALSYLNQTLLQRSELEARFMRDDRMSYLDAKMAADQVIKPDEIKENIDQILHPEQNSIGGYSMEDLEHTAKKHGITIEELMKELGM